MLMLDYYTWIRFGIWMVLGKAIIKIMFKHRKYHKNLAI